MIFLLENPNAQMKKMPITQQLLEEPGWLPWGQRAHRTNVDYCAFGRAEKKPTNFWTNVSALAGILYYCLKSTISLTAIFLYL